MDKNRRLTLTEQETAKVLHAEGRTYHAIARELERSPHTIKKYLMMPETQEKVQEIKGELSDMFQNLAERMITSITDSDITNLSAYQRTVSGAIATDKSLLLKGKATERIDVRVFSLEIKAIDAEIGRLEKAFQHRGQMLVENTGAEEEQHE